MQSRISSSVCLRSWFSRSIRLIVLAIVHISRTFVDTNGIYTTFNAPNATGNSTRIAGINDAEQITGYHQDGLYKPHNFIDAGGVFTTIDMPGAQAASTRAYGINAADQITGSYKDAASRFHGFVAAPTQTSLPEPASLALLTLSLRGLVLVRRRNPAT